MKHLNDMTDTEKKKAKEAVGKAVRLIKEAGLQKELGLVLWGQNMRLQYAAQGKDNYMDKL